MEKIKILVVDDESRMRKLVRDFLVREDYEVLEAGDGEAALDIFYQEKNIALIILDVMMPKMNGWEVCREIRETSKVPIIMLTAKGDEEDELTGFELGVDEYISKPFSPPNSSSSVDGSAVLFSVLWSPAAALPDASSVILFSVSVVCDSSTASVSCSLRLTFARPSGWLVLNFATACAE